LRRFNPRIEEALARLAEAAAGESGYLEELARSYFPDKASVSPTAVSISRRDLLAAHPAMARRIIRLALGQAIGAAVDIESLHVETLLDALEKPPGSYSLPGGLIATTDPRSLIIHRGAVSAAEKIPETKLSVPGETVVGVWAISTELSSVPPELSRVSPDEAYLDAEVSGCELTVRSRRPGDRLRPLGLGGEKKLQDILVDAKVPARERHGVPLVCVGGQIAWVAGHCIDERYAITSSTRNVIHILISRSPGE
jgi:tRNA(Ile)-lysidine synthase